MKILGLIGGISWISTVDYYRLINKGINEKLRNLEFAELMIYSLIMAISNEIMMPKIGIKP
jgi:aspartate racemase